MLALIVSVCVRAGELDYRRFWLLPDDVQETLIEHERNLWANGYHAPAREAQGVNEGRKADADAVAALRARGAR